MEKPFKKIKSELRYQGRVLNLHVDTIEYRDRSFEWEIVELGNAVVIMPLIRPDAFVMLYQYRYTIDDYIWEFPAGRAEDNEPFELSAQRELEEECGYRARSMKKVLEYYPSPGVVTEKMHLYLAEGLYASDTATADPDEIIHTEILPVAKIDKMIASGEIQDAKTILAFYHFKLYHQS